MQAPAAVSSSAVAAPSPADTPSPGYEMFYGLDEKPFTTCADPRFLYRSVIHDRAAQTLLSAIRNREPMALLTGAAGTGKTILWRAVAEELDRRTLVAFVADPFVTLDDLLKTILVEFGVISRADTATGVLARATPQELSVTLREFLLSLVPLDAFAVIVVDEAQNATPDVLAQLVAVCDVAGARVAQVALVGQRPLLRVLRRSELRRLDERVAVHAMLDRLPPDEVGAYVMHRLAVAGSRARVEFDEAAVARLFQRSRGIPRLINLLADRALAIGSERSASIIDDRLIEEAAEDLDIRPPNSIAARVRRVVAVALALVLLALVGAGLAVLVFRDQIARSVTQWEAVPPPPPRPPLRTVAPLEAPAAGGR